MFAYIDINHNPPRSAVNLSYVYLYIVVDHVEYAFVEILYPHQLQVHEGIVVCYHYCCTHQRSWYT